MNWFGKGTASAAPSLILESPLARRSLKTHTTTDSIQFTVYSDGEKLQAPRPWLFEQDDRSGIRPDLADTVREILTVLDDAATPQDLNLPGYRLHPLKGGLKGFWSVTVRANWRIIFRFQEADVFDVELTDYH